MRWVWNKPSFHICLDYRVENNMHMTKISSTESPFNELVESTRLCLNSVVLIFFVIHRSCLALTWHWQHSDSILDSSPKSEAECTSLRGLGPQLCRPACKGPYRVSILHTYCNFSMGGMGGGGGGGGAEEPRGSSLREWKWQVGSRDARIVMNNQLMDRILTLTL